MLECTLAPLAKATYLPAGSLENASISVSKSRFRRECPAWERQAWSSSTLAQRSTAHTIVKLSWEGPVAWHPSKMSSSPMDTSAGRHASAHAPYYHWLSEEREDRLHRARHVAPNSPDLNPVHYAVWGALQQSLPRTKNWHDGRTGASDNHWMAKAIATFRCQ